VYRKSILDLPIPVSGSERYPSPRRQSYCGLWRGEAIQRVQMFSKLYS